jgi:hypothetical protein
MPTPDFQADACRQKRYGKDQEGKKYDLFFRHICCFQET